MSKETWEALGGIIIFVGFLMYFIAVHAVLIHFIIKFW